MTSVAKVERSSIAANSTPTRATQGGRDRGRGRRTRIVSRTKLPRMTNSERGKFYRQKYREYEEQLERDVQRLQGEVDDLQMLLELRHLLPFRYPQVDLDEIRAATQVVYEGLIRLHVRWATTDRGEKISFDDLRPADLEEIRPAEHVQAMERMRLSPSQSARFIARHHDTATPLLFKLESLELVGCSDSRVVVAHGTLVAQYRPEDLETLFPVIRHYKHLAARLLEKDVAYTCTYRFHTANPSDATDLAFASVELDPVSGLLATAVSLHSVEALLSPVVHSDRSHARVKIEGGNNRSTSSHHSSPAELATLSIRGGSVNQNVTTMSTAPRPMELAFILS